MARGSSHTFFETETRFPLQCSAGPHRIYFVLHQIIPGPFPPLPLPSLTLSNLPPSIKPPPQTSLPHPPYPLPLPPSRRAHADKDRPQMLQRRMRLHPIPSGEQRPHGSLAPLLLLLLLLIRRGGGRHGLVERGQERRRVRQRFRVEPRLPQRGEVVHRHAGGYDQDPLGAKGEEGGAEMVVGVRIRAGGGREGDLDDGDCEGVGDGVECWILENVGFFILGLVIYFSYSLLSLSRDELGR